ncbi:GNAT family N-acetyltransferase [Lysinibacillus sp. 54212]|uniref:GNAT family N-acetyltransferase n=1 Tax=Lysinibacillus sp. 54212 TaxID=3119829 RepID=UPI002FC9C5F3
MIIREAKIEDAAHMAKVMKDAEASGFMLFSPGERKMAPEQMGKLIEMLKSKVKSAIFVAQHDDEVVGYLIVQGDQPSRIAHRAYIVIGIVSSFRGKGIGKALFQHAEEWAKGQGIHRLELTVIKHNEAAFNLYKKMGYEVEGTKRDSLLVDGSYVDEYYMAKLI